MKSVHFWELFSVFLKFGEKCKNFILLGSKYRAFETTQNLKNPKKSKFSTPRNVQSAVESELQNDPKNPIFGKMAKTHGFRPPNPLPTQGGFLPPQIR